MLAGRAPSRAPLRKVLREKRGGRCQCIWGESARGAGTDTQHQAVGLEGLDDARTGMPHGIPRGAMCVQRFDDSLNSAIHTTYRISLRSSSMPEPRDPLLKVLTYYTYKCEYIVVNRILEACWQERVPITGPRHVPGKRGCYRVAALPLEKA